MKKIAVIFALLIALGACNDPVFYTISIATVEAEPFIPGSPSNFVNYFGNMYVASGRSIYEYYNGTVSKIYSPGGWIGMLAATNTYLYALCYQEGGESTLRRCSSGDDVWSVVDGDRGGYNLLQSVYADGNVVFIGAQKNKDEYSILQIANDTPTNSTFSPLTTTADVTGELCGVASVGTNYFLCLKGDGNGILYGGTSYSAVPDSAGKKFYGIINLGTSNNIVAITRDGKLYKVEPTLLTLLASMGDNISSGALAVWTKGTYNLLLVGRQDSLTTSTSSGYTYGYMEIGIDSSGEITGSFNEPGKSSPSSVEFDSERDYERYVSTIGKYAVNHIFYKAPDGILFASTQKNGVWSLRVRDGILIWNAQE